MRSENDQQVFFNPIVLDRAALPKRIAERLREYILQGHLQSGDRLPPERDLAERLNVARTSLREAVRLLEATGLLVVRRGKGIYVGGADIDGRFQELLGEFSGPAIKPREIADLYQMRRVLETEAAGWAARRIGRTELAHLETLCEEAKAQLRPPDFEPLQDLDGRFHAAIILAAGNSVLIRIMHGLLDLLAESRRYSIRRPGRAERTWAEHRSILAALARSDGEAAGRAMLRHINAVERSSFVRHTERER